jgi:hypothetical protein
MPPIKQNHWALKTACAHAPHMPQDTSTMEIMIIARMLISGAEGSHPLNVKGGLRDDAVYSDPYAHKERSGSHHCADAHHLVNHNVTPPSQVWRSVLWRKPGQGPPWRPATSDGSRAPRSYVTHINNRKLLTRVTYTPARVPSSSDQVH